MQIIYSNHHKRVTHAVRISQRLDKTKRRIRARDYKFIIILSQLCVLNKKYKGVLKQLFYCR